MFLDTNVCVYAFDRSSPARQARAIEILVASPDAAISTQVLSEFGRVCLQKLGMPAVDVRAAVEALGARPTVVVDATLISEAIRLTTSTSISYWDALIVRAAQRAGAAELLTEDLQHGQRFGDVRVVNPFRDLPRP